MNNTEQTDDIRTAAPVRRSRGWGRFALHFLEMVVAMFAGMLVLGAVIRGLLALCGIDYSMSRFPEVMLVEMGCTMAIGMGVWMRVRGHGWAGTVQMSGAMLLPAIAVVPLVWLQVIEPGTAMAVEHVVMFPLMLGVMLLRRGDYLGHTHA